jgi:hypothetical protein
MALHDLPAARMLYCRAHIALTCHLTAACLLGTAHPTGGRRTVRPRYSQKKEEHRRCDDFVKQLHCTIDSLDDVNTLLEATF